MEGGAAGHDDPDGKEKRRFRSRGAGPSTAGSTELRDPSTDAQESMVYRLFSKLERRFEAQWQDTTAELKSTVMELDHIQRERMQVRQTAAEERIGGHDAALAAQAARLEKIEAELLLAKAPTPRASCGTLLSLQAAQAAIAGAFEEVAEPSHYNVVQVGKGLAKQWTIEFTGAYATAARRAQKALQAQLAASGTWRRVDALAPDRSHEQIYISADASPQQLRIEQVSRRIARVLRERFPRASLARVLRKEGVVAVEWNRVGRITAPRREDEAVVEWNAEVLSALGIMVEEAKRAATESDPSRASAAVNWCL